MYTMCPPGCYHNGFTGWTWAQDVRLHIVGLHCGVTRVLKLRAVSEANMPIVNTSYEALHPINPESAQTV